MMEQVKKVYVIHDNVYATKKEALAYEDGKDNIKPYYIIIDRELGYVLKSKRSVSSDGIMFYDTKEEAEKELEDMQV